MSATANPPFQAGDSQFRQFPAHFLAHFFTRCCLLAPAAVTKPSAPRFLPQAVFLTGLEAEVGDQGAGAVRLRSGFSSRLAGGGFLSLGGGEGERDRETLFWCLLRKALIPPGGVPAMTVSEPKYLSEEGPTVNAIAQGLGFQHMNLGTGTQTPSPQQTPEEPPTPTLHRQSASCSLCLPGLGSRASSLIPHCPTAQRAHGQTQPCTLTRAACSVCRKHAATWACLTLDPHRPHQSTVCSISDPLGESHPCSSLSTSRHSQ